MHVCLLCAFIFPAIESNEECTEEGEIFDYQEKKKTRDKLLRQAIYLAAYLNPNYTIACLSLSLLLKCMVSCCYSSYSNCLLTQAPRVKLLSSIEMTPLIPNSTSHGVVACWLATMPLINFLVELKL
jgi:hypothetical protein